MIKIKRGMDIPIQGAPQQTIEDAPAARNVALVGFDYVGMKPTMEIREGDRVKLGQLLFTDKKTEGVRYTAPASGVISAINRGARRVLQSVVIEVDGDEAETFNACSVDQIGGLDAETGTERAVDGTAHASVQQGAGSRFRCRGYLHYRYRYQPPVCRPRGDHRGAD